MGADLRWGSGPQEGVSLSQPHAQPALGTCCEWAGQPLLRVTDQIAVGGKGVWLEAGHLGSGYAQGQRSVGRDTKFGVEKVVKEFQTLLGFERWEIVFPTASSSLWSCLWVSLLAVWYSATRWQQ